MGQPHAQAAPLGQAPNVTRPRAPLIEKTHPAVRRWLAGRLSGPAEQKVMAAAVVGLLLPAWVECGGGLMTPVRPTPKAIQRFPPTLVNS
jgi:hypothetical protein